MITYKLHIAYDGTNYHGWQIQPNGISIQELIQEAVHTLIQEKVHVIGSGRTDQGVHALDQVAHFRCMEAHDTTRLFKGLNGILPKDIRILSVTECPNSFHAQQSATGKEYHYKLALGPIVMPCERLYRWHVPYKIDLLLLKEAASQFVGTHDFRSFANSAHTGAAGKNSVRTITHLDVVVEGEGVTLIFKGNGFLYKMVRNIVGMLINVASGKRSITDIAALLAAKDRRMAPMASPPHGLFLVKVSY